MLLSVSLGKVLKIVKIKVFLKLILNMHITSPGPVAHLVGVVSHATKRCGFDSQSGDILRLWVWSLIGASTRSNQSMFLYHINVSLSLLTTTPLSPSPSLKWIKTNPWVRTKKIKYTYHENKDASTTECKSTTPWRYWHQSVWVCNLGFWTMEASKSWVS